MTHPTQNLIAGTQEIHTFEVGNAVLNLIQRPAMGSNVVVRVRRQMAASVLATRYIEIKICIDICTDI